MFSFNCSGIPVNADIFLEFYIPEWLGFPGLVYTSPLFLLILYWSFLLYFISLGLSLMLPVALLWSLLCLFTNHLILFVLNLSFFSLSSRLILSQISFMPSSILFSDSSRVVCHSNFSFSAFAFPVIFTSLHKAALNLALSSVLII